MFEPSELLKEIGWWVAGFAFMVAVILWCVWLCERFLTKDDYKEEV